MKSHIVFLTLIAIIFSSCFPVRFSTLKGNYPEKPMIFYSSRPVDSVWSSLIDYVAQSGYRVTAIDKSSGLLMSTMDSIKWTFENEQMLPNKPDRYVVVGMITVGGNTIRPDKVKGDWNVRIKPNANGGTSINVNLLNLQGWVTERTRQGNNTLIFDCRSTGSFERMIAEAIK